MSMNSDQLAEVERLCSVLYPGSNLAESVMRREPGATATSSTEHWSTCQYILENSQSSYALLVAANAVEHCDEVLDEFSA